MLFVLLLALAYGSLDLSFPWWIWVLVLFWGSRDIVVTVKDMKGSSDDDRRIRML